MADHAELVTTLMLARPLCARCLVDRSGLSLAQLDAALAIIEATVVLHRATDRCRACGITDVVFSVERPA